MTDHQMPPAIARLPRDRRGYPIFATIVQPEDNGGEPDFAILDPQRVARCVRDRLCGVCGRPLDYWIAFVGGNLCIEHRLFGFALHPDCARYSPRACPHLSNPRAKYRAVPPGKAVRVSRVASDRRPSELFLFTARRYEPVVARGELLVKAPPFTRIETVETSTEPTGGGDVTGCPTSPPLPMAHDAAYAGAMTTSRRAVEAATPEWSDR